MRIAICDDEQITLDEFKNLFIEKNIEDDIAFFRNAQELLDSAKEKTFDMVFLDIALENDNGIEIAKKLCVITPAVKVVFITAYIFKYINEIFTGVQPYGFIAKPLDHGKIMYYIQRLRNSINRSMRTVVVTHNRQKTELLMADIIYIESIKRIAHICCTEQTASIDTYEKLDSLIKRLDEYFVRCHQSYIVNVKHITQLNSETLTLSNGKVITISRSHTAETKQKYLSYKGSDII